MNSYEIISRIGLEVEVENIPRRVLRNKCSKNKLLCQFVDDHDASSETPVVSLNGLLVYEKDDIPIGLKGERVVNGGEIKSPPLSTENIKEFEEAIHELFYLLQVLGESSQSYRAGIHIHVSMSYSLKILKNIIKLAQYLEDVFYYIGGMGYRHRGVENNFCYFRPITGKTGPICVPYKKGYAKSFEIKDLLNSKSVDSFWLKYGDYLNQIGRRYFPVRYHWINLSSLHKIGTLEFRSFNKTLSPYFVLACIEFCQKFCSVALSGEIPDEINSIFDSREKGEIIDTLENFCRLTGVSEENFMTLLSLVRETPKIEVEDKLYFRTHLNADRHWQNTNYVPSIVKNVNNTNHIDIHNLRGR